MTGRLFLLFIVVPLLDLYLLVRIGGVIGAGPVIALVVLTALLGVTLARLEGFRVVHRWQVDLAQGRMPQEGVLSGVLVLLGAILLVLPGVVTDVVGLLFLLPPTRRLAARVMRASVAKRIRRGSVRMYTTRMHVGPSAGFDPRDFGSPFEPPRSNEQDGRTIEGEGRTIEVEGGTIDEDSSTEGDGREGERRLSRENGAQRPGGGGGGRSGERDEQ